MSTRCSRDTLAAATLKCESITLQLIQTLSTRAKHGVELATTKAQSTQDRYYSRPPDSRWVAAVAQIQEARRKRMLPEESIIVI